MIIPISMEISILILYDHGCGYYVNIMDHGYNMLLDANYDHDMLLDAILSKYYSLYTRFLGNYLHLLAGF